MKNTYILLVILFIGYSVSAQDTTYLKVLNADKNGVTILAAKESYIDLSDYDKSSAIKIALPEINNNIIVIDYGHQREMWKKDNVRNEFVRFDVLNIDNPDLQRFVKKSKHAEKFMKHPWFLYFGGQYTVSPDMNTFSAYGSVRWGFFLLANRWDIAFSVMAGYNASDEYDDLLCNVGFISKLYFPIKKIGLSPYIGVGISCNYSSESFLDVPVTVGLSWRLGPGSLDMGFQYGFRIESEPLFMGIIGYTFCPWGNRK